VTIVVLVLVAVNLGTIVFSFLAILAAQRYRAAVPPALNALEPISILKPLAGLDDALESNLRTFFAQDYPDFEILFAVREAHDPALAVVRQLQQEHPQIRTELFVTGEPPYPNAKVFSLDLMLSKAANDLVVMSDSDIRVTPTLLRTVAAEFQDPALGVATCPYRAVPGESIWSRLEATGMNTDFIAGMLVARMLEGVKFAVGPTIAARRHVLQAIGGFDRLKEYLAEDFMMGKLAAEAGHGVILSSYVIEHHIGNSSFHQNLTHRLRWVRSTRRSRPAGYIGQLFTMPLPIAVALLIADHHWWPISALAIVIRLVAAYMMSRKVLRARLNWLLLPLEDFFGFFCWIAGFWGKTIHWRGRDYLLFSDGTFKPLPSAVSTTSPQARQG
jgi:ceramide glucosyltransferase